MRTFRKEFEQQTCDADFNKFVEKWAVIRTLENGRGQQRLDPASTLQTTQRLTYDAAHEAEFVTKMLADSWTEII